MHPSARRGNGSWRRARTGRAFSNSAKCPARSCSTPLLRRISLHILNRKTGHRVHREFVDTETGERVEAKEQVNGYETSADDYIVIEPEEIAKGVPQADKTLDIEEFVPCDQVDDVYFDRPYYLAPSAPAGAEAFTLIRDVWLPKIVSGLAQMPRWVILASGCLTS